MKHNPANRKTPGTRFFALFVAALAISLAAYGQSADRITLDEAVQMAIQHNHVLTALRTTIQQSEAEEVTQGLRPNPTFFADWEYLPLGSPARQNPDVYSGVSLPDYLKNNTEGDIGISYLIERGGKRKDRLQAQKDITAQTRSLVQDSERGLTFQVATLFYNAQLAESTIDLAEQDLKSFQSTADISEHQFEAGGLSENDYLMIKLQLLQFESDLEQGQLAKAQALSDLRQLLGYDSVPAGYDVAGDFQYQGLKLNLDDLQMKALKDRPDLQAAQQGVTAADSQYQLQIANGKQDVTVSGNYSHVNAINAATGLVSIPLPLFNRNQGEIARARYAITQAKETQIATNGQALTDVKDAYEGLQSNDKIVELYILKYLDVAKKSRDISEYAYRRGGLALIDFLYAERDYRATELGYRQALASYLLAVEQLREAVGTRSLP